MTIKINPSWQAILQAEFDKEYFVNLVNFVKAEYATHRCFPKGSEIFAAFDSCTFEDTRVVIIGQDPYHGLGQANGLCFSVNDGVAMPPSLVNIFKEIESDLNIPFPATGNLQRWAKQGVLLLNATLTVRENTAGSHQNKGWEQFTDAVIDKISKEKQGVVFLLWGGFAKKKGSKIDRNKHFVLETGHPSPLSANRGLWFGNKHFSKTNAYLKSIGKPEIEW
ncbi:uracil-DNA glycosylase [Flavobacterium croceum DSM 17960]|uniref:Uracil-DNA glycosylase n=1 Tax=Flavobacterium croceum DSM 17960 TaxID=1121886 RepID=A0A2S4N7J0_9FLAO|nr:uracil-DNA glycosylase [Flavobacterium croceum]POS01647.1 uracil-DNA glycosylase [Flavobacterium croceum DSM 17960]